MDYTKILQVIKRSPKVLVGIVLGASVMCVAGRFPILVEMNWGTDVNHIKFDSRNREICKVIETVSYTKEGEN